MNRDHPFFETPSARAGAWELVSAGRPLTVRTPPMPARAWEADLPHLPGVTVPPRPCPGSAGAVARLPEGTGVGDTRRLVNAHLHLFHLTAGTLALHAVAVERAGAAVLLLGGHGAGKTMTALALAGRGWRVLAGDVTLLDIPHLGSTGYEVVGGTSGFIVRPSAVRRWFPCLPLPAGPGDRVDLAGHPGLRCWAPGGRALLTAALAVDVDGDPRAGDAPELLDAHTAVSVWWRASSHLLDRVLDHGGLVLRTLETEPLANRRLLLVRALAARMPLHTARGTPRHLADQVQHLTRDTAGGLS
ncbi:hypothetical protein ACIP88_33730 [Streptomyces uncialis]|uniref:hypothetical protein n=1 Tax=Streptomyces uncialis TaxID=1048205 RepID=UPI00381DC998